MEDFLGLCLAILLDLEKMDDFGGALYCSSKNVGKIGGFLWER